VKEWEATIWAAHQRKPTKEEVQQAPEQVLICYKNCKKIKHYFDTNKSPESEKPSASLEDKEDVNRSGKKTGDGVKSEESTVLEPKSLSFSGLFTAAIVAQTPSPITKSATAVQSDSKRGVWGRHLNRATKPEDSGSNSSSQLAAKLAFSYDKTAAVASTRTSLKKRGGGLNAKSRSFFGSLGEDSSFLADLSQASFLDESQASPTLTQGDVGDSSVQATPQLNEQLLIKNWPSDADGVCEDDSASMPLFTSVVSAKSSAGRSKERSTVGVDAGWLQRCAKLDAEDLTPAAAVDAGQPAINSLAHVGSGCGGGEEIPVTVAAKKVLRKEKSPLRPLELKLPSSDNSSKAAAAPLPGPSKAVPTSFKGIFTAENSPPAKLLPGMVPNDKRAVFRIWNRCLNADPNPGVLYICQSGLRILDWD